MRYSDCHPDRKHFGKGMCESCYQKHIRTRPEFAQKRLAYRRKWAAENSEKVKATRKAWNARPGNLENKKRGARRLKLLSFGFDFTDEACIISAFQKGGCAICGIEHDRNYHMDHDHKTGKLRGFLCGKCNSALGLFKDDPSTLFSAIRYLLNPPVERFISTKKFLVCPSHHGRN